MRARAAHRARARARARPPRLPQAPRPRRGAARRSGGMATKEEKERAAAALADAARPVFLAIGLDEKVVE